MTPDNVAARQAELTDVTQRILQLEWDADVYGQFASGDLCQAINRQSQLAEELATQAEAAIAAGYRRFATGFSCAENGRIFLHGTDLERASMVLEAKLKYLKFLNSPISR